jgi:hypothetical protein
MRRLESITYIELRGITTTTITSIITTITTIVTIITTIVTIKLHCKQ